MPCKSDLSRAVGWSLCFVRRKEQDGVGDVIGLQVGHGQHVEHPVGRLGVLRLRTLQVGPEQAEVHRVEQHRSGHMVGWTELTRIECSASSSASVCIRPTRPALAAPYAAMLGAARNAMEELVIRIAPPRPPAMMCGMAALTGVEGPAEVGVDHSPPVGVRAPRAVAVSAPWEATLSVSSRRFPP